jgi:hypothetical protein
MIPEFLFKFLIGTLKSDRHTLRDLILRDNRRMQSRVRVCVSTGEKRFPQVTEMRRA